jgi:hypothetical protein
MSSDDEGDPTSEDGVRPREFRRGLRTLSPAEFRRFVAALWAARGTETSVEGAAVVARGTDGSSRRLLVVTRPRSWSAVADLDAADADAVVCSEFATPVRALATATGADVYDATHLRQQLLYAVDDAARDRIVETFFDSATLRRATTTRRPVFGRETTPGVREALPTRLAVAVLVMVTVSMLVGGLELGAASDPRPGETAFDDVEVTGRTVERATLATAERDLPNATPTCDRSPEAVVRVHLIAAHDESAASDDALAVGHKFVHPTADESVRRYVDYESLLDRPAYAPLAQYETVTFGVVRWDGNTVTQRIAVGQPDGSEAVYQFDLASYHRGPDRECWGVTDVERVG